MKIFDYVAGGTGVSTPIWAPQLANASETVATASIWGGGLLILIRILLTLPQLAGLFKRIKDSLNAARK